MPTLVPPRMPRAIAATKMTEPLIKASINQARARGARPATGSRNSTPSGVARFCVVSSNKLLGFGGHAVRCMVTGTYLSAAKYATIPGARSRSRSSKLEPELPADIYSPPEADIGSGNAEEGKYYVVSKGKFLTLALLTLNGYFLYWFYRNWNLYRANTGESLWPVPRAIFSIFFTHSLFGKVDEDLKQGGSAYTWSAMGSATAFVALVVMQQILDRMAAQEIGSPGTDIISLTLVPVVTYVILQGQMAINVACGDPQGDSNSNYSWANWLWIGFGILLWGIILLGVYLLLNPDALQ